MTKLRFVWYYEVADIATYKNEEVNKEVFVKSELKAKLVQKEMNVETLAAFINKDKGTLYRKLNSGIFTTDEIERIKEVLMLSDKDVVSIFFASPVADCETEKGGTT